MRLINEKHRQIIDEHVITGYNDDDDRLPLALCCTCRLVLDRYGRNDFSKDLAVFDHSKLSSPRMATRNSQSCDCLVCEVARSSALNQSRSSVSENVSTGTFTKSGHPSYVDSSQSERKKPTALRICSYCLSVLRRGKPHDCSKTTRHVNITELAAGGSPKSGQKVATALIRQRRTAGHDDSVVSLSSIDSKPLRVVLSPPHSEVNAKGFPG